VSPTEPLDEGEGGIRGDDAGRRSHGL
jgi:hypothetical protein